jgi:predicted nucleic acid-binding protein
LADVLCNTSPLQYLHQVGLLTILPALVGSIVIPPAAEAELAAGRALGLDLPDPAHLGWVIIRPLAQVRSLSLPSGLGRGETEVLALAIESGDAVVILDDARARQAASSLGIRLTGTLGLLLDAKHAGLSTRLTPVLDSLHSFRFRLSRHTRDVVLRLAGESP